MAKRLGSNPLDFLKIKSKGDLGYLEPRKTAGISKKAEKREAEACIHLRKDGSAYFCESPMARQHGLLGSREEAKQKCGKCYVKIVK